MTPFEFLETLRSPEARVFGGANS